MKLLNVIIATTLLTAAISGPTFASAAELLGSDPSSRIAASPVSTPSTATGEKGDWRATFRQRMAAGEGVDDCVKAITQGVKREIREFLGSLSPSPDDPFIGSDRSIGEVFRGMTRRGFGGGVLGAIDELTVWVIYNNGRNPDDEAGQIFVTEAGSAEGFERAIRWQIANRVDACIRELTQDQRIQNFLNPGITTGPGTALRDSSDDTFAVALIRLIAQG